MNLQTQHPPVSQNQMPQWSRVGQLDKSRYPKVFTRDEFVPLTLDMNEERENSGNAVDKLESDQNPAIRVDYLERSIQFLKAQHQDILSSLHAEIDKLRNENKDLHFTLMMTQKRLADSPDILAQTGEETEPDDNLEQYLQTKANETVTITAANEQKGSKGNSQVLEQQLTELKHQVRELKNQNDYLTHLVDGKKQRERVASKTGDLREPRLSASGSEININMNQIVHSHHSRQVVVHDRTGSARRRPSQQELELIINHLYRQNQQQEREFVKVKEDLKEALHAQKPEAYLVAKAYVAKDGVAEETDILPKLQLKNGARRLPEIAYISRDNASLPALKNTMGTKAAERRKRTQILQRARLHKEIS